MRRKSEKKSTTCLPLGGGPIRPWVLSGVSGCWRQSGRSIWGDATHPIDPDAYPSAQKALVLLTDGEDTHISKSDTGRHDTETMAEQLLTACTAAKQAGIKVFTIAAMNAEDTGLARHP